MTILSGPMFEPAKGDIWFSLRNKEGAHYNIYTCKDEDAMKGIRGIFPDGEADEFNFCLFSTSGIYGSYSTIEDEEKCEDSECSHCVTFLIVHPRIVCTRYGNCIPETQEDFDYLKKLRSSSRDIFNKIGEKK